MELKQTKHGTSAIITFKDGSKLDFSIGYHITLSDDFKNYIQRSYGMTKNIFKDEIDHTESIILIPLMINPIYRLIVITFMDNQGTRTCYKLTNESLYLQTIIGKADKYNCEITELDPYEEIKDSIYLDAEFETFHPESNIGTGIILENDVELQFNKSTKINVYNSDILPSNEYGFKPNKFGADQIELIINSDYASVYIGEIKYLKDQKYILHQDAEMLSFGNIDEPDPEYDLKPYSTLLTYNHLLFMLKNNNPKGLQIVK